MKLFKIPKVIPFTNGNKEVADNLIIGIIDASGSMTSFWPLVAEYWNKYIPASNSYTITFDDNPNIVPDNVLQDNLSAHGGGYTDIIKAFQLFEEKLAQVSVDTSVTVLFISDGEDNDVKTLEKRFNEFLRGNRRKLLINFLCLGIHSRFPTFLSMKLRETYHTGDPTIPAIFLIEYASEKAFLNKFESMRPYFESSNKVNVHPPVIRYPWKEPLESAYERIWVMTDSSMIEIGEEIIDLSRDAINLEGLVELFKGWVQELHLESLKPGNNMKNFAEKALKYMELLFEQTKREKGLDLLKEVQATTNQTEDLNDYKKFNFHQLAMRNMIKHTLSRAVWYYDEVKLLAQGKSPQELDEYDAAKRIGIGTIVGKYHQKALALKNIIASRFKVIKNDFANLLKETILTPTTNQDGYIGLLENQQQVFTQFGLLEGLELLNSPFDLIEALPLIGIPIRLKRYNGSLTNPWLTQLKWIGKDYKPVDSIAILKADNSLQLKNEFGTETVNAVLPLFDKTDEDLRPLLRSQLFHLMMSYNVTLNFDALYEDAYLSLLGTTLFYMLSQKDSEWKQEMIGKIENTIRLVSYQDQSFKNYRELLVKDPIIAIAKDPDFKKYESVDLSKAMLHLYMLKADKEIDDKMMGAIFKVVFAWYFRMLARNDFDLSKIFKNKYSLSGSINAYYDKIRAGFKTCLTNGDLRRLVRKVFEEPSTGMAVEYVWDLDEIYKLDQKVKFETIEEFYKLLLGKELKKDNLIPIIGKAFLADNFGEMFSLRYNKMDKDTMTSLLIKKSKKESPVEDGFSAKDIKSTPIVQIAIDEMLKEFKGWFRKIHWQIMPISTDRFAQLCNQRGLHPGKMDHSGDSLLVRNGCLAPECPHFMQYNKRNHHHMGVWDQGLPKGFHKTVRKYYKLSPDEIMQIFINGGQYKYSTETYERSLEEVLDYIVKLKKTYMEII